MPRSSDKFGVSVNCAKRLCENWNEKYPNLHFTGFTSHSGSQITSLEPYRHSFEVLKGLVDFVHKNTNLTVRSLDLGGGIGISYDRKTSTVCLNEFGNLIEQTFSYFEDIELLLEPGRHLVADAGCLLTTVIRMKTLEDGVECAIVDAGMNDLLRPALYNAHHEILPLFHQDRMKETYKYLIAGPICESSDIFRENAIFSTPLKRGNHLAIMDCGAYGFSMASRYNSRPLAAEILIKDRNWQIIGKPETLEDALKREIL